MNLNKLVGLESIFTEILTLNGSELVQLVNRLAECTTREVECSFEQNLLSSILSINVLSIVGLRLTSNLIQLCTDAHDSIIKCSLIFNSSTLTELSLSLLSKLIDILLLLSQLTQEVRSLIRQVIIRYLVISSLPFLLHCGDSSSLSCICILVRQYLCSQILCVSNNYILLTNQLNLISYRCMSSVSILCLLSNISQIVDILSHSIIVICPCRIYSNVQTFTKCFKFDLCFRSSINLLDCLLISGNISSSCCSFVIKLLNITLQIIQSLIGFSQYTNSLSCSIQQLSLICTSSRLIRIVIRFCLCLSSLKLGKYTLVSSQISLDIISLISILRSKLRCSRITNCLQDFTFSINQILSRLNMCLGRLLSIDLIE